MHKISQPLGKISVQFADQGKRFLFAAVVRRQRFAAKMAEEQFLAATDFAAVQHPHAAVAILREHARNGAVQAFGREVDFRRNRHLLTGHRLADAKAVPEYFALLLHGVPQIQFGRIRHFGFKPPPAPDTVQAAFCGSAASRVSANKACAAASFSGLEITASMEFPFNNKTE